MTNKQKIGKIGELLAKKYLISKGYEFIQSNYYCQGGEVDLIFNDEPNKQFLFIEVKTRTSTKFGLAEDAVDWQKQEKIETAVMKYLTKNSKNGFYRIDLIAVYLNFDSQKANIKYYKSIF